MPRQVALDRPDRLSKTIHSRPLKSTAHFKLHTRYSVDFAHARSYARPATLSLNQEASYTCWLLSGKLSFIVTCVQVVLRTRPRQDDAHRVDPPEGLSEG